MENQDCFVVTSSLSEAAVLRETKVLLQDTQHIVIQWQQIKSSEPAEHKSHFVKHKDMTISNSNFVKFFQRSMLVFKQIVVVA